MYLALALLVYAGATVLLSLLILLMLAYQANEEWKRTLYKNKY